MAESYLLYSMVRTSQKPVTSKISAMVSFTLRTTISPCLFMIFCAASDEFGKLSAALSAAGSAGISAGRKALAGKTELLGGLLDDLSAAADQLEAVINSDYRELLSALERLRQSGDKLEQLVDDRCWPFPKYREMLFIY